MTTDHLCDQHCDPKCEAAVEEHGDFVDRAGEFDWRTDDDGEEGGY